MTTWTQFLADLRVDLKDTGTTQRWTDSALYLWTKDGIRDYSMHFPKRVDRASLTVSGTGYSLPADYLQDVEVEYPLNTFLQRRQERPGHAYSTEASPSMYYISGGKLYLDSDPPSDAVYLTYDALHSAPSSASDGTFTLTIPVMDEELIRLYVKAKASEQLRTQQSSLDRFKLGSGDRQDNPLAPEVGVTMTEYRAKLAERYPGRVIRLWKPKRQ